MQGNSSDQVICGSFENKSKAEERAKFLKEKCMIPAIVKEIDI